MAGHGAGYRALVSSDPLPGRPWSAGAGLQMFVRGQTHLHGATAQPQQRVAVTHHRLRHPGHGFRIVSPSVPTTMSNRDRIAMAAGPRSGSYWPVAVAAGWAMVRSA